ncbi:sigma-70 family RNA polymerase sigma factor [Rhodococcus triatomae]|nr:RNA polymerase sigma factor, sigma-70 family protein [Rhodococcus triatomae BKS 15-14]
MRVLYGQHAAELWRYAMRLTGDRVRAESVVEGTLTRAVERPRLLEQSEGAVRASLFATARDLAGRGAEHDAEHGVEDTDGEVPPSVPVLDDAVGDPPPSLLPRLLDRTDTRRRRIRTALAAVVVAAAAALVAYAITLVPVTPAGPSPDMPQGPSAPVTDQPMQPVAQYPVTGEVSVVDEGRGTRIDVVAHYQPPPGGGYGTEQSTYALVVTDHTGTPSTVASWTAAAGETVTPSGSTDLPMLWVERVDVRSVTTDQVLLTATF